MFKIVIKNNDNYAEMHQDNPMRWRIMLRKGQTLTSQSGLIKCKDFFNDIVANKQHGMKFKVYNFNNEIKFNKPGLYIHLTEIYNQETFCNNLHALNDKLHEQLNVIVHYVEQQDGSVVIVIPHKLWKNTYYISLVTMMIRLCNYKFKFETWDDFFSDKSPMNTTETAFTAKAKLFAKKHGFKLPHGLNKYWFWAGKEYNSANQDKPMVNIVHNNGVSNWTHFMENV
jgi:hypothetical protein